MQPLIDGVRTAGKPPFLVPPAEGVDGMRAAAVLVLFGDGPDGPDVLLLQRSADMRSHAGQPAFPGGRIDASDDGPVAAALREAQEETGLDPAGVEVIATMPQLWIPPSGNVVTPVVAWWRTPSEVGPADPAEVEAVARVPIAALVDPANRLIVRHPIGLESPAFRVANMVVWGFTAGVLSWLISLAGWEREWDRSVVEPVPGVRS
jgi:8-oxo-dGTP pyrophosphatase MutT (NUDIX family)